MRSFTCCTAMSTPPDEPPARMASVCTKRRQPTTQSKSVTRRRSEEHTSELQSQSNIVCRLLLEKKIMRFFPSPDRAQRRPTLSLSSPKRLLNGVDVHPGPA